MTDLPTGWTVAHVGDLLSSIQAGKSLKCEERPPLAHERGVIKVSAVTWGTFDASQSKTLPKSFEPAPETVISAGDFLFSRANTLELVGAVVMVRKNHPNLFLSDKILRLDLDNKLKPWLLKYLQSHEGRRKLAEMSTGNQASMRNIGQSGLKAVSFPLPPLNEQRRIVEKIEAMFERIDKGVENLRAARSTLALYRQSLLKSAFEGRLTADWRAKNASALEDPKALLARIKKERDTRYKAALTDWQTALTHWRDAGENGKKPTKPKRPADTVILTHDTKRFPPSWALATLAGIAYEAVLGKMLDKAKNKGNEKPYLGNINLRWGSFSVDASKTMPIEDHEINRYGLLRGDLVVCEGGEPGRCAVWQGPENSVFIQKALHRIRFTASFNPLFAFYYFCYAADFGLLAERFTGSTIKHLTATALADVPCPICSPAEQTEITRILDARLDAADKMEAEIDAALVRADALRQSILKRAFAGDLVPQDPTDEPAPTLLARIKAERAAALKNKTAKAKSTKPAKRKTKA